MPTADSSITRPTVPTAAAPTATSHADGRMAGAAFSVLALNGPGSASRAAPAARVSDGRDDGGGMGVTIERNTVRKTMQSKVTQHTNWPLPMPSGFR